MPRLGSWRWGALLLPATPVAAATEGTSTAGAALQALAGLLLVVVFIVGAAFVLKRLAPGRFTGSQLLKPISTLALGARERVVVVEIGDRWLVLGVTAASITTLHTAAKGDLPASPTIPNKLPFAAWLDKARQSHADK